MARAILQARSAVLRFGGHGEEPRGRPPLAKKNYDAWPVSPFRSACTGEEGQTLTQANVDSDGGIMKTIVTSIAASGLLAALAMAQPSDYTLTDLGTLPGGTFSQATYISDNGFIGGLSAVADGTQHAVLWYQGRIIDISKPGVLGPNSAVYGVNVRGQAEVLAESSE